MNTGELSRRFAYHGPLSDDTVNRHARVRTAIERVARMLNDFVPEGQEKSMAITKLEEAMMWANAGIARNQEDME